MSKDECEEMGIPPRYANSLFVGPLSSKILAIAAFLVAIACITGN